MTCPAREDAPPSEVLGRLRRFVRRRVRTEDDADDVVQDVLVKFLAKGRNVPARSVAPWLMAVARREIVDRWRDPRSRPRARLEETAASADEADEAAADLSRCIEPMLAAMPPRDQVLLRRIDARGETQADVVREMALRPSTLKSRVQRARRRLRAVLESCCAVEQDRRGTPIAYRRRPSAPCPCG